MSERWFETWYRDFGPEYDKEPYTASTARDVDFIEREIAFDKSRAILDIGCGTGRHSLELARRGYRITGVDLSPSMLAQARRAAERESLSIRFVQANACSLSFHAQFDVALSLCEGAFSLMVSNEDDQRILAGVRRALRPGGKLILETGNAVYQIVHNRESANFDLETLRETFPLEREQPTGGKLTVTCTQRYYTCPELRLILQALGFRDVRFYGGEFNHDSKIGREDFNMLVVAALPA